MRWCPKKQTRERMNNDKRMEFRGECFNPRQSEKESRKIHDVFKGEIHTHTPHFEVYASTFVWCLGDAKEKPHKIGSCEAFFNEGLKRLIGEHRQECLCHGSQILCGSTDTLVCAVLKMSDLLIVANCQYTTRKEWCGFYGRIARRKTSKQRLNPLNIPSKYRFRANAR